jgi:hypothetical protein
MQFFLANLLCLLLLQGVFALLAAVTTSRSIKERFSGSSPRILARSRVHDPNETGGALTPPPSGMEQPCHDPDGRDV